MNAVQAVLPEISVTISRIKKRVVIRDLNPDHRDILVQGEEMEQFLKDLNNATKQMPDVSIGDAVRILTATHVANHWS